MPRLLLTSALLRRTATVTPASAAAAGDPATGGAGQGASRSRTIRRLLVLPALSLLILFAVPAMAFAAPEDGDVHSLVQLALYLGGLSLIPFAVMTLTSFLRIVVVLSFLRSGLGTQNVPPNMVIIALALFLSLFVMGPTLDKINSEAVQPYQAKRIDFGTAMDRAQTPLKGFMIDQLGKNSRAELRSFYDLAKKQEGSQLPPRSEVENYPMRVIIPAFIISELKKAFIMGFAVLLPFLIIDMVISNILLSLGMFMLPPVVVSLPFKVLLFVLSGGWSLVVKFLVDGFVT